ncbi:hypothetical protein [Nocardia suismassiliense]|uniref:hypothetical protein n=1 Tax=Nocardia suismassiliense TaxID=2077092 RepID=UPI00131EEE71|nr:hypothetical protein [Nocardia suismassiliense]
MDADLTPAQNRALDDLLTLAQKHAVEIRSRSQLTITRQPETRPGRGHDLEIFYADSDHVITDIIDVYGASRPNIGVVDWTHLGSDDGGAHDCQTCDHAPDIADGLSAVADSQHTSAAANARTGGAQIDAGCGNDPRIDAAIESASPPAAAQL